MFFTMKYPIIRITDVYHFRAKLKNLQMGKKKFNMVSYSKFFKLNKTK